MKNPFKAMPFREYVLWFVCSLLLIMVIGMIDYPLWAMSENADTEVYECIQVAQASDIEVYRCLDEEEGNLFYVNQWGFMLVGE